MGSNTIWSDIEKKGSNVSNELMGPTYSYADNIQGPSAKGVGSDGTFGQVFTNTGAIMDYVKYMISGPALGNQYFVNTGGTCVATDGSTQPRHNYINNIASGSDLLPQTLKNDLGYITSDFNGLIPGMMEDIEGLNPLHLFSSLSADSQPSCECYTCETSSGSESKFLNTDLTPDFDPSLCKKADVSACKQSSVVIKEKFSNQLNHSPIPLMLAILGIVYLRI